MSILSRDPMLSLELASPAARALAVRAAPRWRQQDRSALAIDSELRGLARSNAASRRLLGMIAAAFLKRAAHHGLGFARLADYARERLGLSAREVQSAAQVVSALAGLPEIAGAFERGELSWTQVRLLTTIATASNEAEWLTRASGRTVRALEALIREARGVNVVDTLGAPAPDGSRVDAALAECAEEPMEDGEPATVLQVPCPARVREAWRETLELAERMAGERLAVWQAAEAIAADGLAGAPTARRARAISLVEASAIADGARHREGGLGWSEDGANALVMDPAETRAAFAGPDLDTLDWRPIVPTLPDEMIALARDLDGLDPVALDARLRRAARTLQQLDWQAGRLLRLCFDRRLYRHLGFSSAARYVRERLGISTGKAAALVAVERRVRQVPVLGDAYRDGRISWLQALTLLPIADARHAANWIVRAGEVTLRRLAAEVNWALDERDRHRSFEGIAPPPPSASLERPLTISSTRLEAPHLQMRAHGLTERCDGVIRLRGPASVTGLFAAAIEAFRAPGEARWVGLLGLLNHVRAEWLAQPRHRDPVFARDGWYCTVPACSSRRNLHDHHVLYRSRGGDNQRSNRTTVCAWHHLRGIHAGHVRVWGLAPDSLRWVLGAGLGVDGGPFLRLNGDRYVSYGEGGAREHDGDGTTRAA